MVPQRVSTYREGRPFSSKDRFAMCEHHFAVTSVTVVGDVDLANADAVQQYIETAPLDHAGCIWVDVSQVTFLDSSGVRALVNARAHLHDKGVVLGLQDPSHAVVRVLELAGVE